MRWLLIALSVILSGQQAIAASPPVQSFDTYKSWFVVCDNGLSCVAKSVGQSESASPPARSVSGNRADYHETHASQMSIHRAAGGPDQFEIELVTQATIPHQPAIEIDGEVFALTSPAWSMTSEDGDTVFTTYEPAVARELIRRLRNAQSIVVGGEKIVSLDGLTAALLRMDERQGLVGTQAALVRQGPRPAASVKPAPPLPRVPYRPITAAMAAQEAQQIEASLRRKIEASPKDYDCERDSVSEPFEVHALTAKEALVFVECIRGAYQTSSLAFIVQRHGPAVRQVRLPTPYLGAAEDEAYASWFTNASFDPKTGELGMFAKGRGLADCGSSAAWIWNGTDFILSEMARQDECGGPYPGDWPVLYRSTH